MSGGFMPESAVLPIAPDEWPEPRARRSLQGNSAAYLRRLHRREEREAYIDGFRACVRLLDAGYSLDHVTATLRAMVGQYG